MKNKTNKEKETVNVKLGHEYVDLGLPSGTLWAKCNIGANSPEDFGDYFAWGEVNGYKYENEQFVLDVTGNQEDAVTYDKTVNGFSWESGTNTYKFGSYDGKASPDYGMTKYNKTDGKTVLDLEDDAAYVNWGENWRMPTVEEISELIDSKNTSHEFTSMNNVQGILFTSLSNGNTLFVPSAGSACGTSVNYIGDYGYCWSGLLYSENVYNARHLSFIRDRDDVYVDNYYRYNGFSVRPVYKDKIQIVDGFNQYVINFPE